MKKIIFMLFSFYSLHAGGVYDGFGFTDEEEKYSIHFLNTAYVDELIGIGLTSSDAAAILNMRRITSLATVAANSNIAGNDMRLIREHSYAVEIPDHSIYNEYTALGIKQYEFNFLMALMGSFIGFTFVFFLVYSVMNISRGLKD